jgi:hypothetical protein
VHRCYVLSGSSDSCEDPEETAAKNKLFMNIKKFYFVFLKI